MASPDRAPLFEATFVHDSVLVRLDIMEPCADGGWHVAEVKSATSRKDCYVPDLATQLWVLRENGVSVHSAAIRHINNQFVLASEGEYSGLLVDVPSLDEAEEIARDRASVAIAAREVLSGPEPDRDMGDHCDAPYPCEFGAYCSACSPKRVWPISSLPNSGRKLAAKWAEEGIFELTDLPPGSLANPLHVRIQRSITENAPFHDAEGARRATGEWVWPRSFLDFETIGFAVPRWIGTRPWQQVPFQFSIHIETAAGGIEHHEFLALDGKDSRRACAEALLQALPPAGAIIAYNASFERGCIRQLAETFPDLQKDLEQLTARIVDLLPVARNHWYHRDQHGSWSIKAVLPTISGGAGYDELNVADGSAAQAAYLEAIHPSCAAARRDELDRDLRAYCALDTRAMLALLDHLTLRERRA